MYGVNIFTEGSIIGSSGVVGFSGVTGGFSGSVIVGIVPLSIRPSKNTRPSRSKARGHFTTNLSGEIPGRSFPS